MKQQDRPAPGRARDPIADLFGLRSRQQDRAFPPLDGLDVFLDDGRPRLKVSRKMEITGSARNNAKTLNKCDKWRLTPESSAALKKLQMSFFTDFLTTLAKAHAMPGDWCWVREMLFSAVLMDAEALYHSSPTVTDAENWLALGAGGLLLLAGRSIAGACLALSSAPLLYRGITGHWPAFLNGVQYLQSPAKGLWTSPDGRTEQDDVVMVEIVSHQQVEAFLGTDRSQFESDA
jgi:hypothetical protein